MRLPSVVLVTGAFLLGGVCGAVLLRPSPAEAQAKEDKQSPDLAGLAKELATINGQLPDQSHAMADVSFHFSNLWFAARKRNWALADFYLSETKSHLRWAVRIKPVRKDAANQDIKLESILEAVENTPLKDLQAAIKQKDVPAFEKAYRLTLDSCYACHKASAKPYLRPGIPEHPPETVLRFEPEADLPK